MSDIDTRPGPLMFLPPASIWVCELIAEGESHPVKTFTSRERADAYTETLSDAFACVIYESWPDDPEASERRVM